MVIVNAQDPIDESAYGSQSPADSSIVEAASLLPCQLCLSMKMAASLAAAIECHNCRDAFVRFLSA